MLSERKILRSHRQGMWFRFLAHLFGYFILFITLIPLAFVIAQHPAVSLFLVVLFFFIVLYACYLYINKMEFSCGRLWPEVESELSRRRRTSLRRCRGGPIATPIRGDNGGAPPTLRPALSRSHRMWER